MEKLSNLIIQIKQSNNFSEVAKSILTNIVDLVNCNSCNIILFEPSFLKLDQFKVLSNISVQNTIFDGKQIDIITY